MLIRLEKQDDIPIISNLLKEAFYNQKYSNNDEHLLVDRLRKEKALLFSFVAVIQGKIVGHIAFSPITINNKKSNLLGLAPVAVLPEYQRNGIGSSLINNAIIELKKQEFDGLVLVGFPDYYQKFGFVQADPLIYLKTEKQYFMKLLFNNDTELSGQVEFHQTFYS